MKRFKTPTMRLPGVMLRNANAYADHPIPPDLVIKCPAVRPGVVAVWGKWYSYVRNKQQFVLHVKRRRLGKVLRRLAGDRRVRDIAIVGGSYIK